MSAALAIMAVFMCSVDTAKHPVLHADPYCRHRVLPQAADKVLRSSVRSLMWHKMRLGACIEQRGAKAMTAGAGMHDAQSG